MRLVFRFIPCSSGSFICMYINVYFKNTSYLLVKIALRFLSRIPKIYVDPRGIAQGVLP